MTTPRRTVWLYYLYRITLTNGFFLPVEVLFLQERRGFGLAAIGLIHGAFGLALVAAEMPTGYLGDRVGRRASLALSSSITAVVMVGFVLVRSPLAYVALYVLWAFGWAFESGTGDAWLYEMLGDRRRRAGYARVRGRGNTVAFVASAISAVLGGLLVAVGWAVPFLAAATLSALGLVVLAALPGVESDDGDGGEPFTPADGLRLLRAQAARPSLRWLVVYSALFYGLFDVLRVYEQPAASAVGVPAAAMGLLYAGLKLSSAAVAATTGWFERRVGTRATFGLLVPVVGASYLTVGLLPVAVVPVIFLTRAIKTVLQPLRAQYVNDRIDDAGRATVLSGVSMTLSLAGGLANLVAGVLAAEVGLFRFLATAGVVVAAVAAVVWVAASPVRGPTDDPSSE